MAKILIIKYEKRGHFIIPMIDGEYLPTQFKDIQSASNWIAEKGRYNNLIPVYDNENKVVELFRN